MAGKLFGRLCQIAYLALMVLPPFALVAGVAQLPAPVVAATAVVSLAPLFALGALSMLASVWSTQTREAVLRVYAGLVVGMVLMLAIRFLLIDGYLRGRAGGRLPEWALWTNETLQSLNPIHVLGAAWGEGDSGDLAGRLLLNALGWGSIGTVSLLLAVWRLRPAYERQLEKRGRKPGERTLAERAPVFDEPLVWKEYEAEGIALVARLRRFPRWSGVLVVFLSTFVCTVTWVNTPEYRMPEPIIEHGLCFIFLATLIVGARSSATICTERERQTWETLLLTPLDDADLIMDRFRGIVRATRPYVLLGYALPAGCASLLLGFPAFLGVAVIVTLLLIATSYMAAVGIWCSVQSRNSWRSLLGTFAMGYASGMIVLFITSVTYWMVMLACVLLIFVDNRIPFFDYFAAVAVLAGYLALLWVAFQFVFAQGLLDGAVRMIDMERQPRIVERERMIELEHRVARR